MTTSRSQRFCALSLVLAGGLWPLPAWSRSSPTPSEIGAARRLFDEGKAAEEAGQFRAAAEKFRRAANIKDTPGIRFHLARCEEEQGAYVEALLEYDRARELLDSGVKAADVEKLLPAARERALAKVALLTIELSRDTVDVTVALDGKPLSASVFGVAMPVNPGKHRVTASAPGRADYASNIELYSGKALTLELELPRAQSPTPLPTAPSTERGPVAAAPGSAPPRRPVESSVDPLTIVLVGEAALFAGGLTTGIFFSVQRSAASDRYDAANRAVLTAVGGSDPDGVACGRTDPPPACAELREAGQDRTRNANFAALGFAAAGVSAAAFGLTYWLWPESDAPASARAMATPGGLAVSIAGRF